MLSLLLCFHTNVPAATEDTKLWAYKSYSYAKIEQEATVRGRCLILIIYNITIYPVLKIRSSRFVSSLIQLLSCVELAFLLAQQKNPSCHAYQGHSGSRLVSPWAYITINTICHIQGGKWITKMWTKIYTSAVTP